MAFSNIEAFKLRAMLGVVEKFPKPDFLGHKLLPPVQIGSQYAEWDVVERSRARASYNHPDAPSKSVAGVAREIKRSQMAFVSEHLVYRAKDLVSTRSPGTTNVSELSRRVGADLALLSDRIDYLVESAIWEVLTTHALTVNQDGIKFTVSYGVSATHTNATVTTSWATSASATPATDLSAWASLIGIDANVQPTTAYMNQNTMDLLVDIVQAQGDKFSDVIRTGAMIDNYVPKLGRIKLEVYDAAYGGTTRFIPDNKVVMIVDGAGETQEGTYAVPSDSGDDLVEVSGKFAYKEIISDPPGIKMIEGLSFLPVIKHPERVLVGDVTTT